MKKSTKTKKSIKTEQLTLFPELIPGSYEETKEKNQVVLNDIKAVDSAKDYFDDIHKKNKILLDNIKKNLPELKALYEKITGHWFLEDHFYRFYHSSFKITYAQSTTVEIVEAFKKLAPEGSTLDSYFMEIYKQGTGKNFNHKFNKNWLKYTLPMLTAVMHAKYFLELIIKYGEELEEAPICLKNGWAAVLTLFNLR